ncbi:MAG: pyruvate kinase, partial [Acutalibacteraceae bacterium]|nr:pyruvate kinase [Acutalibacteraceae bacterium]
MIKRLRDELNLPIAMLADTKGPEIRLGTFENGSETLVEGQKFTLTTREVSGTNEIASITFKGLPHDVRPTTRILIDDGLIELAVEHVNGEDIQCVVINGGIVKDRKGINVPNAQVSLPFLSEQDCADLKFAVENGFDFVAASFSRCAEDIMQMRGVLNSYGGQKIRIIAKIENAQGVDNIDSILNAADGIM